MSISNEIRESFRTGNIVTKLIYINIAVFLAVYIVYIILVLFNSSGFSPVEMKGYFTDRFLTWLMVPADIKLLLFKPWTLITYMFLHFNFFHILFNLLWLYMFGRIFLLYLTEKQLLNTYIFGGLSGAALYIISFNLFPGLKALVPQSQMLGASAGVMGVAMAISFYHPNFTVNLIFLGPVKLKYIALFFIFTDILQLASYNAGGHIAHLGGVLYAFYFVQRYRKGKDTGNWLNLFLDNIATLFKRRKSSLKVSYKKSVKNMTDFEYNKQKNLKQEEIDRILDKIAKSGYESLSKKEKEALFKMGK